MGLRINTNVASLNSARTLQRSTSALNKSLERLSSGLRINRAADDAAGLAIAEGFRSVVRGAQVAQRNTQDGVSLVQTAEGALSETTNILQRVRELAVQAANGTQSTDNRLALTREVNELIGQINNIATDTQFNGISVLSSAQTVTLQSGAYVSQTLTVQVSGARAADTQFNGISVLSSAQTVTLQSGAYVSQTLTVQVSGARAADIGVSAVTLSTVATSIAAISTVDTALRSVNTLRSTFGAFQNRLEFTINTLAIQEENSAAAESAIRDADIARETIQFTRNQILVSAGTSVLAQSNVVPQTALQLLG